MKIVHEVHKKQNKEKKYYNNYIRDISEFTLEFVIDLRA